MKNQKKIFLTIDDSPSVDFSKKINFLHANNIPAIIFCIGMAMEKYTDAVIDAIRKGYVIGNHSYSHPRFSKISFAGAKSEIYMTDRIIDDLYDLADKPRLIKLFRFPYGDKGWNKKMNVKFQKYLPPRIKKNLHKSSGNQHKRKIQTYLSNLGYSNPKFGNITYSFYHELNLANEKDMYWTFDFCEYKIDSLKEIQALMKKKENRDNIHSAKYEIGSLANNSSDDIVLIHDHAETSHLFYEIINHCVKSNFKFETMF